MKLDTLEKLLLHELKDLYNAEKQITKALPKMAKAASDSQLKKAFEDHLEQTKGQIERLETIFSARDMKASGPTCEGMKGLIEEGESLLKEDMEPQVLDAALIGAAQKVEHYEIAGYGTARTFAEMLGDEKSARLLQQTLDEESKTNEKLNKLALESINQRATAGAGT